MIKTENPFILAPMAGITDMPFRRLMRRMGAGCVVTEFVSSHAIVHGGPRVSKYLAFHAEERPVGLQIFGGDDDILVEAAKKAQDLGFDFLDLNLGCPVPKVTRKGGGSAWLCMPLELAQVLQKLRKVLSIPFTIKIRTGWDANSKNSHEIVRIAGECGVDAIAIHGRTRAQGYSGLADWSYIAEVSAQTQVPIIGNGDIVTGPLAAARLETSGCAGVMIGRGALKNPWIFFEATEALAKLKTMSPPEKSRAIDSVFEKAKQNWEGSQRVEENYYIRRVKSSQPKPVDFTAGIVNIRADRDARTLLDTHLELLRDFYPETRVGFGFKKFLAWYSAGYPGAHQFRKFIFNTEDFSQIYNESLVFFEKVKALGSGAEELRADEQILMGGHG